MCLAVCNNRYWGFPTLLLLEEHLFAFVSLFPLYLTGIGGNLPDNMSSSFLFTKLLLVEIILTTCLASSCVVVFPPRSSHIPNFPLVRICISLYWCVTNISVFTINTGIFWVLGQASQFSVIHLYNVLEEIQIREDIILTTSCAADNLVG